MATQIKLLGNIQVSIDGQTVALKDRGKEILLALASQTDRRYVAVDLVVDSAAFRSRQVEGLPIGLGDKGRSAHWTEDVSVDLIQWTDEVNVLCAQAVVGAAELNELLERAPQRLGGVRLRDPLSRAAVRAQEAFRWTRAELIELALMVGTKAGDHGLVSLALEKLAWHDGPRAKDLEAKYVSEPTLAGSLSAKYAAVEPRVVRSFAIPSPYLRPGPLVGRAAAMAELDHRAGDVPAEQRAPVVVIHGTWGVGKSCFAAELIETRRERSDISVAWIDGKSLAEGIRTIAISMGMSASEDAAAARRYVKEMLPYFGRWIIVVEDCVDFRQLGEYARNTFGGAWVLTSRNRPSTVLTYLDEVTELMPLDPADARALLVALGISEEAVTQVEQVLTTADRPFPTRPGTVVKFADWLGSGYGQPSKAPVALDRIDRATGHELVGELPDEPVWVRNLGQRLGHLGGVPIPESLLDACLAFEDQATALEATQVFRQELRWPLDQLGLPEPSRDWLQRTSAEEGCYADRHLEAGLALSTVAAELATRPDDRSLADDRILVAEHAQVWITATITGLGRREA